MEQNRKAGQNPPRVVAPTEEEEEEVVKYIVDEVKEGKYFSTILDSTPDRSTVFCCKVFIKMWTSC